MKNFEIVLKKSEKKGVNGDYNVLQNTVNTILPQISDSSSNLSEMTGCRWIEIFDKEQNLCCLLHCYYKIAFVLEKTKIKIEDVYCVNVSDFHLNEWHINDIEELNRKFPYLYWNEPKEVVDPNRFSLLDMEFATE